MDVDRETLKLRLREEIMPFMVRVIDEKRRELRARGHDIALVEFLDELERHYPKAEQSWREANRGIALSEEYIAIRREVYLDIIRTLRLRASH